MSWHDLDIPSALHKADSDSVSYTTYSKPPEAVAPIRQDYPTARCYGASMQDLAAYSYDLYPHQRVKSRLPAEVFLKWIDMCMDVGLVPQEARPDTENAQNSLHIPCRGYNRHLIYSALCCYRWTDTYPAIPYMMATLCERKPSLDFFQVLHYVMALHGTFANGDHCFIPMISLAGNTTYYNTYGYGKSGFHHVPWSIATKWFYARRKDGRSKADDVGDKCPVLYGYGNTTGAIHGLLTEWGMTEPERKSAVFGVKATDLLSEALTPAYAASVPDPSSLTLLCAKARGE